MEAQATLSKYSFRKVTREDIKHFVKIKKYHEELPTGLIKPVGGPLRQNLRIS